MDPTTPVKDPMLQATLRQMADITLPPPVSMMPATWGWAMLAGLLVLTLVLALWRWLRRRAQNRYRRDALAEIAVLEARTDRAQALAALPEIIKRTALAVWPREQVAGLSGEPWVAFLTAHAGKARIEAESLRFLAEAEYRPALAAPDDAAVRRSFDVARQWIEGHDVHP